MAPIKLTEAQVHALHPPSRDTLAQQIAAVGVEVTRLREQIGANGAEFLSLRRSVDAMATQREALTSLINNLVKAIEQGMGGASVVLHAIQQDVTAVRSMAVEAEMRRGERAARKAVKRRKVKREGKQKRSESP